MNLAETLRGLLRRWYITFPGLILAVAVAVGAWTTVSPSYVRSATELLIPGKQNMPAGSNPLLFLGGLSYAADVLVTAVGAENVAGEIQARNPGTTIDVERSGSSSGPLIVTTVTAPTDAAAQRILDELVTKTSTVLENMQRSQKIASDNRITVVPIAIDTTSTLQQRTRLVATAVAGLAVAAVTLLLASLVDGLTSQRRRRPKKDAEDDESRDEDDESRDEDDESRDEDGKSRDESVNRDFDADPATADTRLIDIVGPGDAVPDTATDLFAFDEREQPDFADDLVAGSRRTRREK